MRASLVLVGMLCGATGGIVGAQYGHTVAANNVRQSLAVLEAIEQMHGHTSAAVQVKYGYNFRTDAAGRVQMMYADGWECVEQECSQ